MEQIISTLNFESLKDKELTAMNGVFKLFEILALDKQEQSRIIGYLNERLNNESKRT